MEKVLVTGGFGAIGRNVVELLLNNEFKVYIVDDKSSASIKTPIKNVEYYEGSITDPDLLEKIFSNNFDYVIHLAAFFANQNSIEHPEKDLLVNASGTLTVARLASKFKVKRLVYVSSSCVYSKSSTALNENSAIGEFDTPYAISKYVGEKYVELYGKLHGLNYSIVRVFNSYGKYELPGKYRNVIPNFIQLALQSKPLKIYGDGTDTRDFTFASDTAQGILLAMKTELADSKVYNLGSGRETKIIDLAKLINQITDNQAGINYVPKRSWDKTERRLANIEKAKTELGFQPNVDLEKGLKETIKWFRDYA